MLGLFKKVGTFLGLVVEEESKKPKLETLTPKIRKPKVKGLGFREEGALKLRS